MIIAGNNKISAKQASDTGKLTTPIRIKFHKIVFSILLHNLHMAALS